MIPSSGQAVFPVRPRLRLGSCRALLRQLCEQQVAWSEIATTMARDPLLAWSVLSSLPLDAPLGERELADLIEGRLIRLGADLLRSWALHASLEASDGPALEHRCSHALLVAELSLQLASETGYPAPQQAYLAGLWHDLAGLFELADPNGLEDSNVIRRADRSAALAARAAPGPTVLDAVRLHVENEDCIADAHALARLLWVACTLAEAEPERALAALSRVAGLPSRTLLDLREDVTYLAEDAMRSKVRPGGESTIPLLASHQARGTGGGQTASSLPWVHAAARGLMHGAFIDVDEGTLRDRLDAGSVLLTGTDGPRLILEAHGEKFLPVLNGSIEPGALAGLPLSANHPSSTLTLALRRSDPVRFAGAPGGPGRSTLDWQIDRWLGGSGFVAWPWQVDGRKGVALFVGEAPVSVDGIGGQRSNLLTASLGELLRARRRQAEREAREEATRGQYESRARRIRHEASNPLSLIRSYLDLLRERHGAEGETGDDLAILGSEIDRIGQMLRRMSGAPTTDNEPRHCLANDVLRDLATLTTDTLFASRGTQLDLRLAAQLPAARIPRSILRQVLLNLLRNAAEAVGERGRVTLASSGPVSVDGRLCVEIRVIDNGQGLPDGRLANLFADGDSDKGEGHDGIGLTIVRDLLREHDCALVCRSQPRAGTGMQIFIPVHA
ncbi:MAG: HDOD domain-containing protein [Rhodocyclaceae bacterium]|nr:HDOD domain-containing protein [Rhodocyclaceae bacterium]